MTPINFTVTLSAASGVATTVQYATADGTAIAGTDYQAMSGTLTIPAGQSTGTITVDAIGNSLYKPNGTFSLNLTNPTNATLSTAQATGTITSPAAEPILSIANATPVTNGANGTITPMTFTVSLSAASAVATTVQYTTSDVTAVAGTDYQAASGTLTIPAGQSSGTITVNAIGTSLSKPTLTFNVNLSNATNATLNDTQATGTILNNVQPTLSISNPAPVTVGGDGTTTPIVFTVTLAGGSATQPTTVQYATADGTAVAGTDYQGITGTVTFAPGQTSQTVTVNALGSTHYKPTETFTLNLSNPTNATISTSSATGTIQNAATEPTLSIANQTVTNSTTDGTLTAINFTVTLSAASAVATTVQYATADGTAIAGTDYQSATGTLTIPAGQTTGTITVDAIGTSKYKPTGTFSLDLTNPTNATLTNATATGTIQNTVAESTLSIANPAAVTNGANGTTTPIVFTVTLSAASGVATTVQYATANGSGVAGPIIRRRQAP